MGVREMCDLLMQAKPHGTPRNVFLLYEEITMIKYTIDDLPNDRPNCGNCTYRGTGCARATARLKDGVRNSCTGNVDGYVYRCVNYQGRRK